MSKPREHSFCSSQKSFFSKKPAGLQPKVARKENNNILDGENFSSESEGGVVKKVDAFSDEHSDQSDSEDCVVEAVDAKAKSTGFFHKLRLRDIMGKKDKHRADIFREGESEEYNSEVDGEIEVDTGINYDILGVREGTHKVHTPLLDLVLHYEELPDDFEDMLTYEKHKRAH